MTKPSLHVLSLPHTQTTKEYTACAYTIKAIRFCNMMTSLGYKVYLYASEDNEANVEELITIQTKEDQQRWFGNNDFHTNFFNITWGVDEPHWVESNSRAIDEIKKRSSKDDIVCVIAGVCQQQIAQGLPDLKTIEYGIGYSGVFADYKVYESYAWMHYVQGIVKNDWGQFFDTVIPNYFDVDDFTFSAEKEDYYLWMGRFISRKGPDIAVEVTKRLGAKLIMAGQGVNENVTSNGITTIVGDEITVAGPHIEHIGHVGVEERKKLLAGAKAVFMPTTYLEPFGGVSIEAMLSGTPVIATNFGAFPENVPHGLAGYRFSTIGEATRYADMASSLDPYVIREYAEKNFSTEVVKYKYDDYIQQVAGGNEAYYGDWTGRDDRYSKWPLV